MKTVWSIFLSIALAVTMMPAIGGLASPAFAGEDDAALQELADNMQHGNAAFDFTSEKSHKKGAMGSDDLPTKYDYRIKDKGEWKKKTVSKSRPSVMLKKLKKGKQYQVRVHSFKRTSELTIFGEFGKTAVSKKIK